MSRTVLFAASLAAVGCNAEPADHGGHHTHSPGHAGPAQLVVRTTPATPRPGEPVTLHLMIHTADGGMVTDFATVHEQKAHLIVVRDGFDEFAHLHPAADGKGNLTVHHTFRLPGTYRLFADYLPAGNDHAVAVGEVRVDGPPVPSPPLVPDAPGRVVGDGLTADVSVDAHGHETELRFALTDGGRPVSDLHAHMGGLGHLILVGADGKTYVHVHPAGGDASRGTLAFRAYAAAGLYKGWLQVRRTERAHTIPFAVRIP
jgi:hypothetical protein